ncbi:MAG: recombinase family protein [Sedimentisphaerales bacterium]|nr:recombinase family protein [Sedimentisphaerales bacterium]
MANESDKPTLRAVGYCRTSGEGQRDNTSIDTQKKDIGLFCEREGYMLTRFYVDECKTGKQIAGRDEFQQMLKDAANDHFEVVVAWDISRFARDGLDIMNNADALKRLYGVVTVDAKNQFDNRQHGKVFTNYVWAGLAEQERLTILERTMKGRIRNAEKGLPWCGTRPPGRTFVWKNRDRKSRQGKWVITEQGRRLQEIFRRYVAGESLRDLEKEYHIKPQEVTRIVRENCVSGTYEATFNAPDIGIENYKVQVPGIPELISSELGRRVRDRMEHRRCWNRESIERHHLTGFVCCSDCGRPLVGHTDKGYMYYRHKKGPACSFSSIHHDTLERQVLDYLYGFIHDEPTYVKAVQAALPNDDDRSALEKDVRETEKRVARNGKRIDNLANAIANGVKLSSVVGKLRSLEQEKETLSIRLKELQETLVTMPTRQQAEQDAMWTRFWIMQELRQRDWTKLPFREVRNFLRFLFGDNPRKSGYGIFLSRKDGYWHIEFKGCVEFDHALVNGRASSELFQLQADVENEALRREFQQLLEARHIIEPGRCYA